jgi:hypothetical protein
MSNPTRISDLPHVPSGTLLGDQIPIARGAGSTGQNYKILVSDISNVIETSVLSAIDNRFLPLSGGTMSGHINVITTPTANAHAASKQYVDSKFVPLSAGTPTGFLPLSGGTMTGHINVIETPTVNAHAASKIYVDNQDNDILNEAALDSLIFQNMKTILRSADLTYSPSLKTVTFAQPWFKLEGLLAIINQTRGQVIYKATQGGQTYDTGTRTLTLKSTVSTTGHNSLDVLMALYAQPGSETTIAVSATMNTTIGQETTIYNSPCLLFGGCIRSGSPLGSTLQLHIADLVADSTTLGSLTFCYTGGGSTGNNTTVGAASLTLESPVFCNNVKAKTIHTTGANGGLVTVYVAPL